MNIRQLAGIDPPYFQINREERNYAAIFFSALCQPGNAERFLRHLNIVSPVSPEFGIYFEYAFLRDLWIQIPDEATKKSIVRSLLPVTRIEAILQLPLIDINRTFGVAGTPSADFLQFPGKWSVGKFHPNFPNDQDFLALCRFKWSFNIKPDIVVHIDKNTAICIEAKYGAGEGAYPSDEGEKAIFRERGLEYVRQTDLQRYMMNDILGIETVFLALVSSPIQSETHTSITWQEAFASLDIQELPAFAREMAYRVSA
jgi:hypothetical protein